MDYRLNHLEQLESESIHLFREVVEQFEKPALLFSGGKDSILMVHLAIRAFWPSKVPFPIVHVDTGHNFKETIVFRDELASKFKLRFIFIYLALSTLSKCLSISHILPLKGLNTHKTNMV